MSDSVQKMPKPLVDDWGDAHTTAWHEAWAKTNASYFFAKALEHDRWFEAFHKSEELDRVIEYLGATTQELCSHPLFVHLWGVKHAFLLVLEALHWQTWGNDGSFTGRLRAERIKEGQQTIVPTWNDGNLTLENVDLEEMKWLTPHLKYNVAVIRGEPLAATGRPAGSRTLHPGFPRLYLRALRNLWDTGQLDTPGQELIAEKLGISVDTLRRRFIEFPNLWPPRWPPRTHQKSG